MYFFTLSTVFTKFRNPCQNEKLKFLAQIHHSVLLMKDQIVTVIIAFFAISLVDYKLVEEISKGINDCESKVQRGPMKKNVVKFSREEHGGM